MLMSSIVVEDKHSVQTDGGIAPSWQDFSLTHESHPTSHFPMGAIPEIGGGVEVLGTPYARNVR
jgi:hypothetical protein